MTKMPSFDNSSWDCCQAMLAIFFSQDESVWNIAATHLAVSNYFYQALTGQSKTAVAEKLDEELIGKLNQLVDGIRKLPMKINGDTEFSPMMWIRIALELQSLCGSISGRFLDDYYDWRDEHIESGTEVLLIGTRNKKHSNKVGDGNSKRPLYRKYCYAPDVFLLKDLCELKSSKWKSSTKQICYKSIDRKRTVKENAGSGNYAVMNECITKAANNKYIKNELLKMDGERYISSGSRKDLLAKLRTIFKTELYGSDKAYIQIISALAACGKYKRTK